MKMVVDSSVAVKWLSDEEEQYIRQADLILEHAAREKLELAAPVFMKYEVGNALIKGLNDIEIKKFITLHGLALNVKKDQAMFGELKKVNPCGLSSDVYRCMEDYLPDEVNLADFTKKFLKTISC